MAKVLDGIRVLDFSRYISGPYCGMLLADMGAEVIRVERPGGEDDRNLGPFTPDGQAMAYAIALPRNKKSLTLNIRTERGRQILSELVRRADIVLHNFTPTAEEAKVLHYDSLKAINPSIIGVIITGFGQEGPSAGKTCFDSIAQAMSGAMSYGGFPGSPPTRASVPYVDFSSGLSAALGAMFALFHRERTGIGQLVDISMLDVAFGFVAGTGVAAEYRVLGEVRQQIGNSSFYNFTDCFKARDGWVMISIVGRGLWRRFCRAIEREELIDDPRFKDDMARYLNRDQITPFVAEWMGQRTMEEAIRQLEGARLPCGPVNTIAEAVEDRQIAARQMLVEVDQPGVGKIPIPGVAIRLSQSPGGVETCAPALGEHNEEIYCGLLGLEREELTRLKQENVI
jgi:CoA:oxalate CoA-transferase